MNLFKNLLFLHGHFTDPRMDEGWDEPAPVVIAGTDEDTCHARNDAG